MAAVTVGLVIASGIAYAKAGVDLQQCRNGSFDDINDCEELGGGTGWVSGNAGSSNAHFHEGESIPYRLIMTDLPVGDPVTITLGYDVKHSGAFAIDFMTYYDRLPDTDVFPTDGFTDGPDFDLDTTDTEAVVAPSTGACATDDGLADELAAAFASVPAADRVITIWGGTISPGSFAYGTQACLTNAQSETTFNHVHGQ
jgi:hypothetical protein